MVRRPEGPLPDQGLSPLKQPGNAVDPGGFDGLLKSQRRQDRRNPPRQHGLARTRRPDHQEVVPPRGGDLQRAFDMLLAFNFGEIEVSRLLRQKILHRSGYMGRNGNQPPQKFGGLAKRLNRDDRHPRHHRCLLGIVDGNDDPRIARIAGGQGCRKGAGNRLYPAVERQLTQHQVTVQGRLIDHPRGR